MTEQCQKLAVPVTGNAANRTNANGGYLDLTGEPAPPAPLPGGFTAKGYGAMAGCVIAAVMGMITIVWYGLTDPPLEDTTNAFATSHNVQALVGSSGITEANGHLLHQDGEIEAEQAREEREGVI
jgi:hypothetical protein